MNILIATNHDYIKYTTVMLYSLFMHNDMDIVVYLPHTSRLSDEDIQLLDRFIGLFPGKSFHPFLICDDFDKNITAKNGVTIEAFYRILAIDRLPKKLDKILYLDVDVIIQGSLKNLYDTDITGRPFAVCEDYLGILNDFHEANKYRMGIPKEYSYFNSGVMLFNLTFLREHNSANALIQRVYDNQDKYQYNDQDVMNEMYYDNLVWLPWDKYNCPPGIYMLDKEALRNKKVKFASYKELKEISNNPEQITQRYIDISEQIKDNATIVHYMGAAKPWTSDKDSFTFKSFGDLYFKYELPTRNRIDENGYIFIKEKSDIIRNLLADNYTFFYIKNRLNKATEASVKTLIMGSSYGVQGILDNEIDDIVSLSGPSQDLYASINLCRKVIEDRKRLGTIAPKRCVVLIGYYALYDNLRKAPLDISKSYNITYEPIFDSDYVYDYRKEIKGKYRYLTDDMINECLELINGFFSTNNYFNNIYTREDNDKDYVGKWYTLESEKKKLLAENRCNKHNHLKCHSEIMNDVKQCLANFVDYLSYNDVNLVFVIPPFSKEYNERIDIEYKDEIFKFLDGLNNGVSFIDLNDFEFFCDEDFFDSDHLNDTGARKLTDIIMGI